jgi:hypothetical protein
MKEILATLIQKHTADLNAYKANRAKSEEEKWSDKEVSDCDFLIQQTAAFIRDLKSVAEKKQYFLFGSSITGTYFDSEFSEVLERIKSEKGVDYAINEFDFSKNDLGDLLEVADGWGGYAEISEEEYNQIKELQTQGH